ncbi:DUF6039 family protein [Streptomyces sp. RKAG293]|uniref:DUF6039 family protein n=1 Tax=Streptomyces sp. RKAG293 TaxID=2893403 RepID=UPI002034554C|nr:DUF6039 family protein [Streptomyces sp. RKAG293]MCM2416773.1 DUF6039 family protein [Streptomyces sp. RKAG293]
MTQQTSRREPGLNTAAAQSPVPADKLLHSGNAGFIIARSAQLKYEHRAEGRKLFADVIAYMNQADLNGASFFFYEEAFGRQDRVHWLIHWKTPNDFAISLHMVDHDEKMIDMLESDRVVDDASAGVWGRAVVEGSVKERILVPQHGLVHEEGEHQGDVWVDPARLQTGQSEDQLLHSANSVLTLHRVGQASHEFRKEARHYAFAWQNEINTKLAGRATSYLYEETFGVMDRLHWLIHLKDFDTYQELLAMEREDEGFQKLQGREFVAESKGGGRWGRTFVQGTIEDTLLLPYQYDTAR